MLGLTCGGQASPVGGGPNLWGRGLAVWGAGLTCGAGPRSVGGRPQEGAWLSHSISNLQAGPWAPILMNTGQF